MEFQVPGRETSKGFWAWNDSRSPSTSTASAGESIRHMFPTAVVGTSRGSKLMTVRQSCHLVGFLSASDHDQMILLWTAKQPYIS